MRTVQGWRRALRCGLLIVAAAACSDASGPGLRDESATVRWNRASAAASGSCGRPQSRQPVASLAGPPHAGHGYVSTRLLPPGRSRG